MSQLSVLLAALGLCMVLLPLLSAPTKRLISFLWESLDVHHLCLYLVVTLGSLMVSQAGWQHLKASRSETTLLSCFAFQSAALFLHWIANRTCKNILLVMLMAAKCNIWAGTGQHCGERMEQWKPLPRPSILLRLLIDRTSHGPILHRRLPGKVPLFLWETQDMRSSVNKSDQLNNFP